MLVISLFGETDRALLKGARPSLEMCPKEIKSARSVPMSVLDQDRQWSAVCRRGHVLADHLDHPDQGGVPKFCSACGAPVITHCEACSAPLLGGYRGVIVAATKHPKPFCFNCGAPHGWATREQRVRHLENLLEFDDLDEASQLTVIEELAVLAAPADQVDDDTRVRAGERVRNLAPKLWETGRPVIQSVLTEAANKSLGLS